LFLLFSAPVADAIIVAAVFIAAAAIVDAVFVFVILVKILSLKCKLCPDRLGNSIAVGRGARKHGIS